MLGESGSVFVAVDGPKHAGKTTVLDLLVPLLQASGLSVLRTKEPSETFDLSQQETHAGADLARLLADDRGLHLQHTIVPGLRDHHVVITDRYIASSLAFQVLDGVPFDQVWAMNSGFPLPDLNIFLTAAPESIHRRLASRDVLTRFDRSRHTEKEIAQYEAAAQFLRECGVRTAEFVNDDGVEPIQTAAAMAAPILDCFCRT